MAQQRTKEREKSAPLLDEKGVLTIVNQAHDQFLQVAQANPVALQPAWAKEVGFATQRILKDELLMKAAYQSPASAISAVTNLAAVGLSLNPIKQQAALLARYNRDAGGYEVHLSVMVKGFIYLGNQAGVHDINAEVVYTADKFKIGRTHEGDIFEHVIAHTVLRNPGGNLNGPNPFLGCYVQAVMPGSTRQKLEWVPAEDIFKMRDASDACWIWEGEPGKKVKTDKLNPKAGWVVWFDEYAKKSGIKRASKRWEESIQAPAWENFRQAIDIDNRAEGRTFDNDAPPPEPVPCMTIEQLARIEKAVNTIGLSDTKRYNSKICETYGVSALSEIPAKYEKEILERIDESKKQAEARRAKK